MKKFRFVTPLLHPLFASLTPLLHPVCKTYVQFEKENDVAL